MLYILIVAQALQMIVNISVFVIQVSNFRFKDISTCLTTWHLLHLPLFLIKKIQYVQGFEWMTMIHIIRTQKDKTLGEIMYELNNSNKHKEFQKREKIHRIGFVITVTALFLFTFLYQFEKEYIIEFETIYLVFENFLP